METPECNDRYWLCIRPKSLILLDHILDGFIWLKTYQMPFLHNSLVRITAHMASSPLVAVRSVAGPAVDLAFPLSPTTSPSIPRSTIPKSIACTARLSLWFFVRRFAVRISERIVLRMNARSVDEVVRGRRGNRHLRSLDEI